VSTLLEEPEELAGLLLHQVEPLRHGQGAQGVELELDLSIFIRVCQREDPRSRFHTRIVPHPR